MKQVSSHLTTLILLNVVLLASADYQFELRLISYNNPRGFTEDLNCCDAQFSPQTCVPQDQCDTEFFIRLRNFDRGSAQLGSTKLVGVYQDMNMISFPSCGALTGNFDNPLVYTFPTSQFTTGPGFTGETLRIQFDISDEDIDPVTNRRMTINISPNTIWEIFPVPGTNSEFTMATLGAPIVDDLTVSFEYRLICTPGSCGSDCSQTTGCAGFPAACPAGCGASDPCLNGGTCTNSICSCLSQYTGARCETTIAVDTTAAPTQMMTPAPATTARATDAPTNAPATTQSDGGGTDGDIVTVGGTTAAGQGSTTDGVGGTSEALSVHMCSQVMVTLSLFLCLIFLLI